MKKLIVNILCLFIPVKYLRHKVRNSILRDKKPKVFKSASYWNDRYVNGGNSGAGSYNNLAQFKSDIINEFIKDNDIDSIIEFGSGDGNNLLLYNFNSYVGIDVSKKAVEITKEKFKNDNTKQFMTLDKYNKKPIKADISMSLDVIYHLIEDDVFISYMNNLINAARKYVIIYSSNMDEIIATHVKHRKFTDFILSNYPNLELIKKIDNKFPYDENNPNYTSFADFYIYKINDS